MADTERISRIGRVVSNKMDKTVVVQVEIIRRHRVYGKAVRSHRRFMAHDEDNQCSVGDLIRVVESRPLSRHKRWRMVEIVQAAELTSEERAAAFANAEEGPTSDPTPDQT